MTSEDDDRFTVADFNRLGELAGFRYRLPDCPSAKTDNDTLCVAQGCVREHGLRPGLRLVLSDIMVHHRYEAQSLTTPQFSAIVMLQGSARVQLNRHASANLVAQSGLRLAWGEPMAVTGLHPAQQRLRCVNISFDTAAGMDAGDDRLGEAIARVMRSCGTQLRRWTVPSPLLQSLEQVMDSPWQGSMYDLLLEGASLQLLAHALADDLWPVPRQPSLSARDRQLLARVRERLDSAPGEPHSLATLAKLACMSPSTLRAKFQAAYHCSLFAWLRERRLEVARAHLAQGCSVQQAAHFVGYRHASNFATAFRARYGIAPSALKN